jgi:predicted nucleic acid-binding protein
VERDVPEPSVREGLEEDVGAVRLRQSKKIELGDSLIAGTALLYDLTLVTRNVDDFLGIEGLRVLNPFAARPSQT